MQFPILCSLMAHMMSDQPDSHTRHIISGIHLMDSSDLTRVNQLTSLNFNTSMNSPQVPQNGGTP